MIPLTTVPFSGAHFTKDKNCKCAGSIDIFKATEEGKLKDVIHFIETGSSPNQKDAKDENYLLHIATTRGHSDIVKYLLEKDADVNAKDNDKRSALHLTSEKGHLELVPCLIEKGADVNAKDKHEQTAFQLALKYGHKIIAQYLIENDDQVTKTADLASGNANIVQKRQHF